MMIQLNYNMPNDVRVKNFLLFLCERVSLFILPGRNRGPVLYRKSDGFEKAWHVCTDREL